MTINDIFEADFNSVVNTGEFSKTVTHRPEGVSANDTDITAVFIEEEQPTKQLQFGEEIVRTAEIHVSPDVTLNVKDQFVVDSELWQLVATFNKAISGVKFATLQRNDKSTRKGLGNIR